jgi:uncharacterized protein (DUF427 family)
MSEHNTAHNTAAPMVVPQNGNIPAGWVGAEVADAQQRQAHREAIWRERAYADAAAVEAEVDRRILVANGGIDADVKESEVKSNG